MFPRLHAPPIVRKPTLPLPDEHYHKPALEYFEAVTQTLLAMAPAADKASLTAYRDTPAYNQLRCGSSDLLLTAIDPASGDSVLHRAAAAGNIAVLNAILTSFGPQISQRPEQERLLWVLITHQNGAGDTALHAAAHAGNLTGVKAIYRLFHGFDYYDVDEDVEDPPVEYWDWAAMDDSYSNLPALDFVCTRNRAGRDAAGEARAAGWEDLAVWLEGLVARLDRDGMRGDEEYMREARLTALENHWYCDDGEEK